MSDHHSPEEHSHHPSYGTYIVIWLALLGLTALTVAVAGISFGNLAVFVALIVATIKSYLVVTIFMHIKIESKVFTYFIFAALFFFVVSLILLFADYRYL